MLICQNENPTLARLVCGPSGGVCQPWQIEPFRPVEPLAGGAGVGGFLARDSWRWNVEEIELGAEKLAVCLLEGVAQRIADILDHGHHGIGCFLAGV